MVLKQITGKSMEDGVNKKMSLQRGCRGGRDCSRRVTSGIIEEAG